VCLNEFYLQRTAIQYELFIFQLNLSKFRKQNAMYKFENTSNNLKLYQLMELTNLRQVPERTANNFPLFAI